MAAKGLRWGRRKEGGYGGVSSGEERHLHPPPPPGLFFRPPTGREESGAAEEGERWVALLPVRPPPTHPLQVQGIAVGCAVLIPSTKPVATAPPSAASRALQRLRLGVGEAQPGVARRCGGLLRVHPGRCAVWLEPWLQRKPGGFVRSPLRARLEKGHVVGRLLLGGRTRAPEGTGRAAWDLPPLP